MPMRVFTPHRPFAAPIILRSSRPTGRTPGLRGQNNARRGGIHINVCYNGILSLSPSMDYPPPSPLTA